MFLMLRTQLAEAASCATPAELPMIEYFLYTTQLEPPAIEAIRETAAQAGWHILVARDWENWGSFTVIDQGPLQDGDVTVGWMFRWPDDLIDDGTPPAPPDVEDALATHKRDRIDALIRLFEIGAATWFVDRPFDLQAHLEFDGVDDARIQMGDAYADHLLKSRCKYTLAYCPNCGFNNLVMGTIAMLTEGMLEDPMSAVCAFPPKDANQLARLVRKTLHRW